MQIMSDSIKEIAKALAVAQSKITNVKKDKSGYGYKYAELVGCLEMIKKPLAESDLALVQLLSMSENGSPTLVSMLTHSSGEWIKSVFPIKSQPSKQTNDMQALGSGITYLRRYALCSMLGIAQEDDDGISSGEKKSAEPVSNVIPLNNKWAAPGHNWAKLLQNLCDQHSINVKDFAAFHNLVSTDVNSVKNAVENFNARLQDFMTYSS